MNGARETRRAVIVMVLLVSLWGYSWITSKIGLNYASPIDVVAMRLELGMLTLLGGPVVDRQARSSRSTGRRLLIIGLIQTGAFLLLNTWALSEGGPGKTSILVFTMPFWVLVFAWPMSARAHPRTAVDVGRARRRRPVVRARTVADAYVAVQQNTGRPCGHVLGNRRDLCETAAQQCESRTAGVHVLANAGGPGARADLPGAGRPAAGRLDEYVHRRYVVQRHHGHRPRMARVVVRAASAPGRHHQPLFAGHSRDRDLFLRGSSSANRSDVPN